MTMSRKKNLLLLGVLAIGVVLVVMTLTKTPQAEEPVLGPGYRTANLNIEGMT
ncbi:MAG: hypothetical protein IIC64_06850 [SAR324 cluster bacterium]|nr:hypothetical protein [SAR324 cluster bacterium]